MPPPRGLVQRLDQRLHRQPILPRGGRLLVACSGGPDSVALVRLLHAINQSDYWRWQLMVAHIDHGIRGRESAEDAEFVHQLAAALGLEFLIAALHLGRSASEAQARAARFKALSTMVRHRGAAGVVMGHHADDQAETVLLRIVRGCGLEGLGGMTPVSTVGGLTVFRPLLEIPREELRAFLADIGQTWRHDATNDSDEYLRNRVRHELLPLLKTFNPQVRQSLLRLAALSRDAHALIGQEASAVALDAVVRIHARKAAIQRRRLRGRSPLLVGEVIRYAVSLVGGTSPPALDYDRLQEAVRVILGEEGGKRVQLGGGLSIQILGETAVVMRLLKKREAP